MKITYGLLKNPEVYLIAQFLHNWASTVDNPGPQGERSADFGGLGDLNLTFKYQFLEETARGPSWGSCRAWSTSSATGWPSPPGWPWTWRGKTRRPGSRPSSAWSIFFDRSQGPHFLRGGLAGGGGFEPPRIGINLLKCQDNLFCFLPLRTVC